MFAEGSALQVYDLLLDSVFNILMREMFTADNTLAFKSGSMIRLFFGPHEQVEAESAMSQGDHEQERCRVACDIEKAHGLSPFALSTVLEKTSEGEDICADTVAERLSKLVDAITPQNMSSWSGYKSAKREGCEALMKFVDDGMLGTVPDRTELV